LTLRLPPPADRLAEEEEDVAAAEDVPEAVADDVEDMMERVKVVRGTKSRSVN